MQTRSSDENSVRLYVHLSVCQTRALWKKTKERSVQIFTPYERPSFILVFWEEEWFVWGGRPFLPENLGQPAIGAKSPILNRYSLVAPQP